MEDPSLAELFTQALRGDKAASRALYDRIEPELKIMVRVRLPKVLRTQFDTMDFVQSVWRSIFDKDPSAFPPFENSRHLLGYLAGLTANLVVYEHRRRTRTRKYDLSRQEALYVRRGDREILREVAAQEATPSEGVQAKDRLSQIMRGLDERERKVVELRLLGHNNDAIAEMLGISESAVRRILKPIRTAVEARERRLEAREWP